MRGEKTIAGAGDQEERWWYRVGGLSALLLGLAYVLIVALYVSAGAPPRGGEAWLTYAAGKTAAWWAIVGLSVLTDVLFVPVAVALYVALRRVDRTLLPLGTACVGLFVVLDLAVTWPNIAALVALSGSYAAATTDAERAASVAAATYASAVLTSTLVGVYSIADLSVGILLIGLVMLRSPFGKATAYLGVATGILGIVSVAGPLLVSALGPLIILTSVLTTVWVLLVGYRLYRLGQP
jgi:hypothetical protein